MRYHVWELEDNEPVRYITLLSTNKKKLRGKWQIFVKENMEEDGLLKGYTLTNEDIVYAVYNDRSERVFNKS